MHHKGKDQVHLRQPRKCTERLAILDLKKGKAAIEEVDLVTPLEEKEVEEYQEL